MCTITLVSKCRFPLQEVKELMMLMVLQHAVKYHEACDWIHLQDQSTLTYQSLLNYCPQLEARCDQFKQGRAQLASITLASASQSLPIQSATTQITCKRCGYTHPHMNCLTFNKECYSCHNKDHFTALCRKPKSNRQRNTLADLVLQAHQEDQHPEHPLDGTIDLRAEENSPTEAPAVTGTAVTVVTVGAPHKTATTEGHPVKADAAHHHLYTRSATSLHPQTCPR